MKAYFDLKTVYYRFRIHFLLLGIGVSLSTSCNSTPKNASNDRHQVETLQSFSYSEHLSDDILLTANGKSTFEIYFSRDADTMLRGAAEQFQDILLKATGAKLEITHDRKSKHQIILGDREYQKSIDPNITWEDLEPGGFRIKTVDNYLLVLAIDDTGLANGMYTFLERYLGCRYYTSNAVKIPELDTVTLPAINHMENPAFDLAFLHSFEAFSPSYAKWHKIDLPPRANPKWAKPWIHTTTQYINAKEYYRSHPEYFMLWNGKRIAKDVDFSDDEVFNILKEKLREEIQRNPAIEYLGVSQADRNRNQLCQCSECRKILEKGAEESSVILNLANNVAAEFPSKVITTLAYHYSLDPPKNVKPEKNVLVIICNTEYDRLAASNFKPEDDFIQSVKGWKALTDNIMIWDYVANTSYPHAPFPNLFLLQKNIRNYAQLGVPNIFVQSYHQKGDEFQELRSYLLAKLLWNPDINVDSVMNDFLRGYYGDAAPYIRKYIDKMAGDAPKQLRRNVGPEKYLSTFLSISSIKEYEALFNDAKKAVAGNTTMLNRVDKAQQSLRFAKLEIYKTQFASGGLQRKMLDDSNFTLKEYNQLLEEFVEKIEKYGGTKVTPEIRSPKAYMKSIQGKIKK